MKPQMPPRKYAQCGKSDHENYQPCLRCGRQALASRRYWRRSRPHSKSRIGIALPRRMLLLVKYCQTLHRLRTVWFARFPMVTAKEFFVKSAATHLTSEHQHIRFHSNENHVELPGGSGRDGPGFRPTEESLRRGGGKLAHTQWGRWP